MLNPRNHPNAFAAFTPASVAAFLIYELEFRLHVPFSTIEEGMIVAGVAFIYLVLGGKVKVTP